MKLKDMHGTVAMELTAVQRHGETIEMKGKAFGSMPLTVYVKPEDLWDARRLLSWSLIWYLPVMFVKGWRRSRTGRIKAGRAVL
jgi:hypothetical protein